MLIYEIKINEQLPQGRDEEHKRHADCSKEE